MNNSNANQIVEKTFSNGLQDDEFDDSSDFSQVECICNGKESVDQNVIGCDECKIWYHRKCIGMSREVWRLLGQQKNKLWLCPFCEKENQDENRRLKETGRKLLFF